MTRPNSLTQITRQVIRHMEQAPFDDTPYRSGSNNINIGGTPGPGPSDPNAANQKFADEMQKAIGQQHEYPNRPIVRVIQRMVPQPAKAETAFVSIDLPVEDAHRLRALLGALNTVTGDYVRSVGPLYVRPGLYGLSGPSYSNSEVLRTAAMVHNAIRQAGF